MQLRNRQAGLAFIFVTLFLDILGIGIIIPILPQLVTELSGGDVSSASSYYGWLVSAYALMQFLFAPLFGSLSDRFGRRPVILAALFGAGIDLLIMGFAPTLTWLFIGRIIAGITGASIIPANAYIADVSPPEKRAQNFGLVGAAFGLGFIVGPALGGLLGTFGPRIPFFFAAAMTLLNWLYGYFVLPESLAPEHRRPFSLARSNPLSSVLALKRYPVVFGLVGTYVCLGLAQQALQSTWVLFTTYRFDWTALQNGLSLAFFGVMSAVVQVGLLRVLIPRLGERRALLLGLLISTISYTLYGLVTQGWMMYGVLMFGALSGITQPAAQGLISNQVGPSEQGELQGSLTSLLSLTGIFGPVIATWLFGHFTGPNAIAPIPGIAFFWGSFLSALAGLLALRSFMRQRPAVSAVSPAGK
jgi:MFS transporter, DHA1 family, tetracycline resistance protein